MRVSSSFGSDRRGAGRRKVAQKQGKPWAPSRSASPLWLGQQRRTRTDRGAPRRILKVTLGIVATFFLSALMLAVQSTLALCNRIARDQQRYGPRRCAAVQAASAGDSDAPAPAHTTTTVAGPRARRK